MGQGVLPRQALPDAATRIELSIMETRAPFIIVGAFVLAAIGAVFGFVYWLHNTAGTGARTVHHVQFEGSVSGLLVGAAVLFNGIRVGEVTNLGLVADSPRRVDATIAVASSTPVHCRHNGWARLPGSDGRSRHRAGGWQGGRCVNGYAKRWSPIRRPVKA